MTIKDGILMISAKKEIIFWGWIWGGSWYSKLWYENNNNNGPDAALIIVVVAR